MIYLIGQFIPSVGDVVDCGSNMGFYPLLEKKLSGGHGRQILCIEPDPRNITVLRKNISVFGDESFKIISGAVSNRVGVMSLNVSRESNLNFIAVDGDSNSPDCITVDTFTLDSLIMRYGINPTFLRMDIEGHEVEVFNGAREWAISSIEGTTILFETHSPMYKTSYALYQSLCPFKENGFAVKCIVSAGGRGSEVRNRWNLLDGDKFKSDGFDREIFWNVNFETACEIASAKPKLSRYMLLVKGA